MNKSINIMGMNVNIEASEVAKFLLSKVKNDTNIFNREDILFSCKVLSEFLYLANSDEVLHLKLIEQHMESVKDIYMSENARAKYIELLNNALSELK